MDRRRRWTVTATVAVLLLTLIRAGRAGQYVAVDKKSLASYLDTMAQSIAAVTARDLLNPLARSSVLKLPARLLLIKLPSRSRRFLPDGAIIAANLPRSAWNR